MSINLIAMVEPGGSKGSQQHLPECARVEMELTNSTESAEQFASIPNVSILHNNY